MRTTIETVTPQQAAKWLEPKTNHDNRQIRQGHVEYLAQEIIAGRWQVTHQGIAFAKGGRLLDGQHRLSAIVRSGKAVQIQVTHDADEDTFKVTDCGLGRVHYDRIHLVNDQVENKVICQVIRAYLVATRQVVGSVSVDLIEDEFLSKDAAWMWVGQEFRVKIPGLIKSNILAALAVYRHVKPELAERFSHGYRTGANLAASSPILALRQAALTKSSHELSYWHAVWAMVQHMKTKGQTGAGGQVRVIQATEDMLGNKAVRLARERSNASAKGAETVKKKAKVPA